MTDTTAGPPDPTPQRVLTALSECAVDLADLRDPHLVLRGLVRRTRALLGTDLAYLSLNDLARGETHIEFTDGVRTAAYRAIRMPLGTGVLGAVAAGGLDVQTGDYLQDPAMNHLPVIDGIVRGEGVRAIHGCPVRAGGRVVGALLIAHRTPIHFTRRQVAALRRMAEQAAIALQPVLAGSADGLLRFADELVACIPKGPQVVVDLVAGRLDEPVELHGTEPVIPGADDEVLRTALSTSRHTGQPVAVPRPGAGPGTAAVTVLSVGDVDDPVATLLVPVDPLTLGERGQLLLSRAGPAVGAAVVVQRRLFETEMRGETDAVETLVGGSPVGQVWTRFRSWGFARRRPVVVLAVTRGVADPAAPGMGTVDVVARRCADGAPVVVSGRGEGRVVIAQVDDPAGFATALHGRLGGARSDVLVGWSVAAGGLDDAAAAHRSAHRTVVALQALGTVTGCADPGRLGLAGLLVAGADPEVVDGTIVSALGPLLDLGPRSGTLLETAWVVLECGGRWREAAARLHVHPNTVRQRVERISAVLGADWRRAPRSLDVHVATRLWRLRAALAAESP